MIVDNLNFHLVLAPRVSKNIIARKAIESSGPKYKLKMCFLLMIIFGHATDFAF